VVIVTVAVVAAVAIPQRHGQPGALSGRGTVTDVSQPGQSICIRHPSSIVMCWLQWIHAKRTSMAVAVIVGRRLGR